MRKSDFVSKIYEHIDKFNESYDPYSDDGHTYLVIPTDIKDVFIHIHLNCYELEDSGLQFGTGHKDTHYIRTLNSIEELPANIPADHDYYLPLSFHPHSRYRDAEYKDHRVYDVELCTDVCYESVLRALPEITTILENRAA